MARVLVTGGQGLLGSEVDRSLSAAGHLVRSPGHQDFDVSDLSQLERLRKGDFGEFDWIVNCAGYTDVDQAEEEPMAAMHVNGIAPGALAAVAQEKGWRLLHVSSDYVFDGQRDTPYREDDQPNPVNAYGRSKLAGEVNALREDPRSVILRASWMFGPRGRCFPTTILGRARQGGELRVVADQFGTPTYAPDLALVIASLVSSDPPGGVLHAGGPETVSWHAFAERALAAAARAKPDQELATVAPIKTADWPTRARRPPYSALDSSKIATLGVPASRSLDQALDDLVGSLTAVS